MPSSDLIHECTLLRNSISHLPKNFPDASRWHELARRARKFTLVSPEHPHVLQYLKSSAAIENEGRRQVEQFPGFIIHPLSKFRQFWNIYIFLVMFVCQLLTSFSIGLFDHMDTEILQSIHIAIFIMKFILFVEVILQFLTGYIVQETFEIVLDPSLIAKRYLSTHCIPDLIACIPFSYTISKVFDHTDITISYTFLIVVICLFVFYVFRFNRLLHYSTTISSTFKLSANSTVLLTLALRTFYCWHWLACVRLLIPLFHGKNGENPLIKHNEIKFEMRSSRSRYWFIREEPKFLDDTEYYPIEDMLMNELRSTIHNSTVLKRYTHTMMVTLRFALQSGFENVSIRTEEEMLMNAFIMFSGWITAAYIFVEISNVIMASESSVIKYEKIRREIQAYCDSNRLSAELTRRIHKQIEIKYRKHYFNESEILKAISSSLRTEIMMNSCSHLVSKVPLFKDIPKEILVQIVTRLKLEIFFPGDIIIRAGTIGDCMFFISSGAAEIIAESGDVMNRLIDGSHFGEISLLARGNRRIATVKAVEVCETYKLSRRDFRKVIEPHQELLRYLEQIALQRIRVASTFRSEKREIH